MVLNFSGLGVGERRCSLDNKLRKTIKELTSLQAAWGQLSDLMLRCFTTYQRDYSKTSKPKHGYAAVAVGQHLPVS